MLFGHPKCADGDKTAEPDVPYRRTLQVNGTVARHCVREAQLPDDAAIGADDEGGKESGKRSQGLEHMMSR